MILNSLCILGVRERAARALQALRTPLSPGPAKKSADKEMESLFSFSKKRRLGKTPISSKQQCVWKHRFVCLAYSDQTRMPTTDAEKDELLEAGLGEKEVEFVFSDDMDFNGVKEVLFQAFPRLQDGGGFQFLKGVGNSRTLEPLSKMVYTSLKVLKQRVGQGRTYIRPIQRSLDLSPVFQIEKGVSYHGRRFTVAMEYMYCTHTSSRLAWFFKRSPCIQTHYFFPLMKLFF